MLADLADLALDRPWAILGTTVAAIAVTLALAAGAPGELAVGSLRLDDPSGDPDLVLAIEGEAAVGSRVYEVTLDTVESQLLTDQAVEQVRRVVPEGERRPTSIEVFLGTSDAGETREAIERIETSIDPGSLRVAAGGEDRTLAAAGDELSDEVWRLELLALPFVLLVLAASIGVRLALGSVLAAAGSLAAALAGLRLLDGPFDLSLLGIAPAAVIGLALAVELPGLLVARYREEAVLAGPDEALRRTLVQGAPTLVKIAAAAAIMPLALLATPLDQASSIVIGCVIAVAVTLAVTLTTVPALIGLVVNSGRPVVGARRLTEDSGAARALRAGPAFLARSAMRTVIGCLVAAILLGAASVPALDGDSRPFAAADLPRGSEPRDAAQVPQERERAPGRGASTVEPGSDGDSLFGELPPAAAIALGLLALALVAATGAPGAAPLALFAPLLAATAAGLLVFVFGEGHLADAIGQERQDAVETGALACTLVALVTITGARCVGSALAARGERRLGMPADAAAETAAPLVLPAAISGTLVTVAASGVLAGSDLVAAREFGLAVAAGLLLDLILVRIPFLAAAARWGGR